MDSIMTSKERVKSALNFHQPDRIPVDFGATPVTGIHSSVVEQLRDRCGLAKRPVKIHEPFQMLGWIDDDLAAALGLDVIAAMPRGTMFGNLNTAWKPWRTPWGQEVLIAADSEFENRPDGSVVAYPQGDRSAGPSALMPAGGFFFDAIIRQQPFDEDNPEVEDNLEEFGLLDDAVIGEIAANCRESARSGRAVVCGGPGTALGDIALVPAVQLKAPKGIRDVAEWYMSLLLRPDFVKNVFARQTEIAIKSQKAQPRGGQGHRRPFPLRHRLRHPDFDFLQRRNLPRTLSSLLPEDDRLHPRRDRVESLQALLRRGDAAHRLFHRGRIRHSQSGPVLGHRDGPG